MDYNLINIDAAARQDVVPDVLSITFSATETADTSGAVTTELRRRLDAALVLARPMVVPKDLELKTGAFSVAPVWAQGKGKSKPIISGYQGRVSLTIYGSGQDVISAMAGRITTMDISDTSHSVSRALQTKIEGEVLLAAIDAFKQKAATIARGFDAVAFNVVTLHISPEHDHGYVRPRGMMRAMSVGASLEAAGSAPLEIEAGTTSVGVIVQGSIQLVPRGHDTSAAISAILNIRPGQP